MRRSASKRLQDFANSFFVRRHPATRAQSDGLHFPACALDVIVDDGEIIAAVVQHFLAGPFEPPVNLVFGILPARPNAPFEFRARRRQNKNGHRARKFAFHLQSALDINFQDQIFFVLLRFLQPLARSAVPILAEHLSVFQEFAAFDHLLELTLGNKIVPLAVALRLARRPSGTRNRQQGAGDLQNLLHQGRFSGTRGAGDDQHQRRSLAHSMFCTCSRNFSISDLISRPRRVMSRPAASLPGVLESNVFDSRCISWSRKSSFLPTSEAPESNDSNCCTWLRRRASSSETSLRSAAMEAS